MCEIMIEIGPNLKAVIQMALFVVCVAGLFWLIAKAMR